MRISLSFAKKPFMQQHFPSVVANRSSDGDKMKIFRRVKPIIHKVHEFTIRFCTHALAATLSIILNCLLLLLEEYPSLFDNAKVRNVLPGNQDFPTLTFHNICVKLFNTF